MMLNLPQDIFTPGGSVYRPGMVMANSPDQTGYIGITYEQPDVAGGDLWVYYSLSYQSQSWNRTWNIIQNDTNGISPAYNTSNLSFGLDNLANGWHVSVYIDNLFDQATYGYVNTSYNDNADLFGNARDHNVRSLAQPRTTWLTVEKDF